MRTETTGKPTDGPWFLDPDNGSGPIGVWGERNGLPSVVTWCSGPNKKANAQLIAAALDLLIAAKAAYLALRERQGQVALNAAEDILEEALTKATGLNMWTGEPVKGGTT